ncbi:hypothetical protein [Vibrio sonorensis]|uniref:hypothetical protein n=1 Tax=Vibrio sonorensis TaxID=1004316 RepID=UPI001586E171|nr:hypothetical protein [Vibrio sonorensis]
MALEHGGKLLRAIEEYGGTAKEWVDLSTGVSPFTYPAPEIPSEIWNRLPEVNDGLERTAQATITLPLNQSLSRDPKRRSCCYPK